MLRKKQKVSRSVTTVTKDDIEKGPEWRVYHSLRSREGSPRTKPREDRKHLRLVKGAFSGREAEGHNPSFALSPEELTSREVDVGAIPKRQQQSNKYHEDDRDSAEEGDVPNIKREFILTRAADDTLQDAVRLLSRATGANLTNSHFLRVVLKTVQLAMTELEREAAKLGKLKRPSNARGNEAERDEYEEKLAEVVHSAIRSVSTAGAGKAKRAGKRTA
jgi:hypothetical protein